MADKSNEGTNLPEEAKEECWNCGGPIGKNWNYCTQCTYPVDSEHVFFEFMKYHQKKENIVDNAPNLLAEGIREYFSEEELKEILREERETETGDDPEAGGD